VDFNPARGSEQAGRRPALVISLDSFNARMSVCVVAAMSSQIKSFDRIGPVLEAGNPCELRTQVLAFQVLTVDQGRLGRFVGSLTPEQQVTVDGALKFAWGLK